MITTKIYRQDFLEVGDYSNKTISPRSMSQGAVSHPTSGRLRKYPSCVIIDRPPWWGFGIGKRVHHPPTWRLTCILPSANASGR